MDKFIESTLKMQKQINRLDKQLKPIESTLKMHRQFQNQAAIKMIEQAQSKLKLMNDLAIAKNIEKNMTIAERIKQLRKEHKITQGELAEKTGFTRTTIGNYERGETKASINVLSKIADVFDMTTNEFLKPCIESKISPEEEFKNHLVEFLQEKNIKDSLTEEEITALKDKVIDFIGYELYKKEKGLNKL